MSLPRGSLTLSVVSGVLATAALLILINKLCAQRVYRAKRGTKPKRMETLFRNYVTSRQAGAASDSVVVVAPFQGVSCSSIAQQRTRSLRATAMMAFFLRFFWLAQIL